MDITDTFVRMQRAWEQHPRFIDSCGGTRSGKTFAALQLLYLLALTDKQPTLTSVVSETYPHLKRGAIRDFKTILGASFDDAAWKQTDSLYTLPNGSQIEYFSAENVGRVMGAARDRLFLNECNYIPYDIARQLFVRTREFIVLDYNPTHVFWVNDHIQPRADCISIHSTYRDNPFLTPEQIAEIEAGKSDAAWWRVYGEGLTGQREGVIYDFEQIDSMPDDVGLVELFGLDFGFTNDPTACVRVLCDTKRKHLYIDEVCYSRGMLNADIADMLRSCVRHRSIAVYADCSEPKTIAELCGYGFNVLPCYKGTRKAEQVQSMRAWKWHVTKRSTDVIRELRGYVWQTDRDGNAINEPSPFNDHAMDAIRYAVFTRFNTGGDGQYSFTIKR